MHRSAPIDVEDDGKMFVCGKWNSKYLHDFNMNALQRTNFMNRNMAMLLKYTSKMYRWPCNCYKNRLNREISNETQLQMLRRECSRLCDSFKSFHVSDRDWSNRFYSSRTSGKSYHAACAWILITWTNDTRDCIPYIPVEDEKPCKNPAHYTVQTEKPTYMRRTRRM